jgi:hypothetical protein
MSIPELKVKLIRQELGKELDKAYSDLRHTEGLLAKITREYMWLTHEFEELKYNYEQLQKEHEVS